MKLKMIKYFAFALFSAAALTFTACEEEEPIDYEEPTLSFSGTDAVAINFAEETDHAKTIAFTVTVDAPAGIKAFTLHKVKLDGVTVVTDDETDIIGALLDQTTGTYNLSDLVTFEQFVSGGFDKIEYEFIVTDNEDQVANKKYTVTEVTAFPTSESGMFYNIVGADPGAYDLDNDVTVIQAGEPANKHLINTDVVGVAFTGSWMSTTPTGNGTEFVKVTGYDFTAGLVKSARLLYAAGTPSTVVDAPAVNDIYVAKLDTKYYVIKVTAINPTEGTGVNKGQLTFDYLKY